MLPPDTLPIQPAAFPSAALSGNSSLFNIPEPHSRIQCLSKSILKPVSSNTISEAGP